MNGLGGVFLDASCALPSLSDCLSKYPHPRLEGGRRGREAVCVCRYKVRNSLQHFAPTLQLNGLLRPCDITPIWGCVTCDQSGHNMRAYA